MESKGKLGLLMLLFLVGSYFLYQHKSPETTGKQKENVITVTGQVTDRHSGKPIVKATVEVTGTPTRVVTDDQGVYSIPASKGNQLLVTHPKYRRMMFEITGSVEDIQLVSKDQPLEKKTEEMPTELQPVE